MGGPPIPSTLNSATGMTMEIGTERESRYSKVYLFCFNFGHYVNQIDNQETPVFSELLKRYDT